MKPGPSGKHTFAQARKDEQHSKPSVADHVVVHVRTVVDGSCQLPRLVGGVVERHVPLPLLLRTPAGRALDKRGGEWENGRQTGRGKGGWGARLGGRLGVARRVQTRPVAVQAMLAIIGSIPILMGPFNLRVPCPC